MPFFSLSFTKSENRKAEQVLPAWGLVPMGAGRRWEKEGEYSINTVYSTYMYVNGKMRSVETVPGMKERG
jgi:hypothetical protein